MSVLIKGMEKPEHCGYCRFRYDGICHALQRTQYSMNECPLVVIDDAGLNDTISRQAAIDVADYADCTGLAVEDVKKVTDEVVKELKKLPPVDAVQVVRCKDCKYWNPHIKECKGIVNLFGLANEWSENGFCFKGERKEE